MNHSANMREILEYDNLRRRNMSLTRVLSSEFVGTIGLFMSTIEAQWIWTFFLLRSKDANC